MQNETPQPDRALSTNRQKQKLSKPLIIIIVLLLIFGFGSVIFLARQTDNTAKNKTLSKNILNNPAILKLAEKLPLPKITLIPITPDETTVPPEEDSIIPTENPYTPTPLLPDSWRIYKNTALDFTINYPATLKVNENSHGLGIFDVSFIRTTDNTPDYQLLIYPKSIGKLIGQDFDILYNLPSSITQRMTMSDQDSTPQQFTKIANLTIDNLRAFTFRTTSDPPNPDVEAETGAYIEIADSIIIISTKESNKAALDSMLSTFKTL